MKLFTIPNILTLSNLLCGCLVVFSFFNFNLSNEDHIKLISILIFLSLVFDFLDGFIARLLKSNSNIGKELDSLADLISFGLVPSLIMYKVIKQVLYNNTNEFFNQYFLLFPILIALFSALRLAKFNVDESQSTYFKGLATPANTILILSIGLVYFLQTNSFFYPIFKNIYFLILIILVCSGLLISNIPMFSFKISGSTIKQSYYLVLFVLTTILALFLLKFVGLFLSILLYIIISIIFKNKITQLK
ncbi:MAG: CDP-diacylglycerol--serine O-phosphatidyltransferase [Solirubrobacteraceae bacterium]